MKPFSSAAWFTLFIVVVFGSGCTEEKAKALQLGAESFKTEADAACQMGLDSLRATVAMPQRTRVDVAKSISSGNFGPRELQIIYSDAGILEQGIAPAVAALNQACEAHRRLAAIYTDLPRGYLLSTEDVKRAQKHAVNVVVRFARLTQIIGANPTVGRDNIARIRIIEARQKAMAVSDEKARAPLLDAVAEQILENQAAEVKKRAEVLAKFAKATVLGEKLVELSSQYDQISLNDILESLREFSSLYGDVTGRSVVAQHAIDRVKGVEDRIKTDPLLSPLLEADLTQ